MINKNVFNKTKDSLIKINIAVVVTFLIIFSIFIYSYFKGLTYNSVDKNLKSELENISIQLSNTTLFYPITLKDPSNLVYVYEGDIMRYYTQNGYFEDISPKNRDNKKNEFFTYTENGYTFRELSLNIGKYKIQIIRNIDDQMNSLRQLVFVFIIGIMMAVVITYFMALYLTKKSLIPFETAWDKQTKFVQDASHELRTPIAIVSSKLESMLKTPNKTISDQVENIADAMKETRRIKKMINDLLILTKEDCITKTNTEPIDIFELLKDISNDYIDIAQIQGKEFNINLNLKNKIIITDKNKLRQLLLIFIDNAFKYTQRGDTIAVEVNEKGSNISLLIVDTGIGIKEGDIPYIFDRFFRSDNVRNKDIDGSGIGLSIAKIMCLNLDFEVKVDSKLNEYTKFELIVPIN